MASRNLKRFVVVPLLAAALVASTLAAAREYQGGAYMRKVSDAVTSKLASLQSVTVRHQGEIEVAFSPGAGAAELVEKVIHSARHEIRLAGYSFTDAGIARALVDARRRGVDVMVVLDKSQRTERYSSGTFLANAGIPVRINSRYAIMHQKTIVADRQTVETGSFNFTKSGRQSNSENVIVVWNNPQLAQTFLANWQGLWNEAEPYAARY